MTQRDINIISMVYEYEGCAVEHIRQVFFQEAKNRSIPCYRRLSYLIKQGYLRSLLLPALNKHFLIPGAKARSVLSYLLKASEVRRIRIESPMLILHKLAICDIRVSLELASKASSLFVLSQWINESALRRSPLSVEDPETKKQTTLIPDAGFTLITQTTGRKADFFLEMDMATVSLKHMRQRVRGYLLRQDQSPVLFVVPDASR
jgi:protein involved in plasmid replication-relaxation